MKKNIFAAISLAAFIFIGGAHSFAGDHAGNGGGIVHRHGVYMSFYTAGLYVEPIEGATTTIPGLSADINYVMNLSYLGFSSRAKILGALTPSAHRHYYIASPQDLTLKIKRRLLEEYQRVTHIDPSNLELAAITDTKTGTTFILPHFFNLSHSDKMTIFFHEAYWVMHPSATYNEVVNAEMAFEAALESPNDFARVYDFVRRAGSHSETYKAAVNFDLHSGALSGLLKFDPQGDPNLDYAVPYIPFDELLGADTLKCMGDTNLANDENSLETAIATSCLQFWRANLNGLINRYPKSTVLKMLASYVDFEISIAKEFTYASLTDGDINNSIDYPIPKLTEPAVSSTQPRNIRECEFLVEPKVPTIIRCPRHGVYGDEELYIPHKGGYAYIESPDMYFYNWLNVD